MLTPLEDHLNAPRGRGALSDAPHAGAAGGAACGDLIRISVEVDGEHVARAGFDSHGCAAATAAGSAAVELLEGTLVLHAARLTADHVAEALGGLVPSKMHAATLAADALHRALGAAAAAGDARLAPSSTRTLVAMSGGVDSAVAARLAQERGDEVVAVTLELWSDPEHDGAKSCCSPQAVAGARALAHRMGLPHFTLDLREAFRREVVEDFLAEHAAGRTPNPCVRCNGLVRFEEMLALAGRLGAARLATGHYARVERDAGGPLLRAGADPAKDQTYMLARLPSHQLERLSFPLGALTKPEVRECARASGLPVADKAESQDLCFLSGIGHKSFLARRRAPRRGAIVRPDGAVLGHHGGQDGFTIGQRRGLGVAAAEPLYVLDKDAASGRVTVGPRDALAASRVGLNDAVLHRSAADVDRVKLRYRSEPIPCRVEGSYEAGSHPRLALELADPADAVAPGQTACLMRGDLVVGSATICRLDD